MAEQLILDPAEVAQGRTELNINSGAIRVKADGIDWGDAEVSAYMAEQARGETPVDFRVPNRQIQVPLVMRTSGTVTFAAARAKLQAKVARIQQEGGWLKRITSGGGTLFMDLVNATLNQPGSWEADVRDYEPGATLSLEAIPDFYGNEVTLGDHFTTTATELSFTETGIVGNFPARVRAVVDNDVASAGSEQRGIVWAFRSRHYSNAATAAVKYEAEALDPLDVAAVSGGTLVRHATLLSDWTPVLGTNLGGATFMTHTGAYRVFGRVRSTQGTAVSTRLTWSVGALAQPVANDSVQIPGAGSYFIVDYGEVQLGRVPVGTHRWQGQIQGKGPGDLYIDALWFANLDEGMGILRAPPSDVSFTDFVARDSFDQTAGAASGKTLITGGTWTGAGSGTGDFTVESNSHTLTRSAFADTDPRFLTASSPSPSTVAVQAQVQHDTLVSGSQNSWTGVVCRYVSPDNWVGAAIEQDAQLRGQLVVWKYKTGTLTPLYESGFSGYLGVRDLYYTVRLSVLSTGNWAVYVVAGNNLIGTPLKTGYDADLATGGTLATGKVGVWDYHTEGFQNVVRFYDNFQAWAAPPDAVAFPGQSLVLQSDGIFRASSTGATYGPVPFVEGDLPRLPPSGTEGRAVEVLILNSRGDFDAVPDNFPTDAISARLFYRPSWIQAPET